MDKDPLRKWCPDSIYIYAGMVEAALANCYFADFLALNPLFKR
jgi:hypothetical protein